MGKYDRLKDRLIESDAAKVTMTFSEIDRLIGGLPTSALERDAWWSNEDHRRTRHVQCKAWGEAGYCDPDRRSRIVTFHRR